MKNRLKILAKLDDLQDKNCSTCSVKRWNTGNCYKHCDVGKEIKSLGEMLLQKNRNNTEKIIDKGENMTTNEVKTLLDKGMTRKKIAKIIGIPQQEIKEWFNQLEQSQKKSVRKNHKNEWGKSDMKSRFQKTVDLLKKNKDITPDQVSEKLGITKTTASNYLSKARTEIKSKKNMNALNTTDIKAKVKSDGSQKHSSDQDKDKKVRELERENKALKDDLKDAKKELEQEKEKHKQSLKEQTKVGKNKETELLESEINHLRGACDDLDEICLDQKEEIHRLEGIIENLEEINRELKTELEGAKNNRNLIKQTIDNAKEVDGDQTPILRRMIEDLKSENDGLKDHNGKQSEELYKREQYINELRDDLEMEREKHKHLRGYSLLLMQEEGAINA